MIKKNEKTFDKIKYFLSAKDTYIKNKPILINFTLQNISNEKLWILTWYTPLEGIKGRIFFITCDGKEISYEGPMVKRSQPSNSDYKYIEPGGSISKDVDLSTAYKIPESKECKISFKGKIHDYTTSDKFIPKKNEDHQMIDISGNSITIHVKDN